ncbi:MAG: MFS transporter [Vallitaleaceae bacterium]|jgi:GPH family glycoside/pentoside/hexuronide:cation symporter|nr:MFS transporter [Vallitaleaceae bacterium]
MKPTNQLDVRLKDKIGYGMGNFSYGIISQTIATYIVFFGTNILGITGTLIGLAVSISIIWDGLTDPIMGYVSDHTNSKRFGRRHIYLIMGIIGMAGFNLGLWFINPNWPMYVKYLLIVLSLLAVKTFITIYTTPYTALGAELSEDYNERSSIQGFRTMFFLLGIMTATVMGLFIFFNPTAEYSRGQNNPEAYTNLGVFTTVIAIVFAVICIVSTFKYIPFTQRAKLDLENKKSIKKLFTSFLGALRNKYFSMVALAYLFTNVSSALLSTLGLHVYTYTFGLDNQETAVAIGIVFMLAVVTQPMWVSISKKVDKKPAVLIGLGMSLLGSVIFVVLVLMKAYVVEHSLLVYLTSVILGSGIGGLFSLPLSMIADSIDFQELSEGIRSEGTYYGVLTLAYKMSQSIAILFLGILLDIAKFDSQLTEQASRTTTMLGLAVGFGCILSFTAATICYLKYDLNRDKVKAMQIVIKERRNQLINENSL